MKFLNPYEDELNAYDDAIVRATDIKGSLELAYEKGEVKGRIDVARQLLDILDIKTIAQKTGLTIQEIEKLKKV